MPKKIFLVGLAGGSGAGKSRLLRKLALAVANEWQGAAALATLSLDDYYKDRSHMLPAERERINYDHPEALDFGLLKEHLRLLKTGQVIAKPVYAFASHTRAAETQLFPQEPAALVSTLYIMVEGILSLYDPELRALLDSSLYLDVAEELRLTRRLSRDQRERGRDRESVLRQYQDTVLPMHKAFVEGTREHAVHVLKGSEEETVHLGVLLKVLRGLV